jgi:hypothetical protein
MPGMTDGDGSSPDSERDAVLADELPALISEALDTSEIAESLAEPRLGLTRDTLRDLVLDQRTTVCEPARDALTELLAVRAKLATAEAAELSTSPSTRRRTETAALGWTAAGGLVAAIVLTVLWWSSTWWVNVLLALGALAGVFVMMIIVAIIVAPTSPSRNKSPLDPDAADRALRAWRAAVLTDGVLPTMRSLINARRAPWDWATMKITDTPGLDRMRQASFIVRETQSAQRFRDTMAQIRSGAVGVAGSRGVGKTTLLEAYQGSAHGAVAVLVPAPVRYEARDFVLHLYATLCRASLDRCPPVGRAPARFRRTASRALGLVLCAGLTAWAGWGLSRALIGTAPSPHQFGELVARLPAPWLALWPSALLWLVTILLVALAGRDLSRPRSAGWHMSARSPCRTVRRPRPSGAWLASGSCRPRRPAGRAS